MSVPTDATDVTEVEVPNDFVLDSGSGFSRGSHAPLPIGPPSWEVTVGMLFKYSTT